MVSPTSLAGRLYAAGSLANEGDGFAFTIVNALANARLTGVSELRVDDAPIELEMVTLDLGAGPFAASSLEARHPLDFPVRQRARVRCAAGPLANGAHEIRVRLQTDPYGELELTAGDAIGMSPDERPRIPNLKGSAEDYAPEMVARRQAFAEEFTGVHLRHVPAHSSPASETRGNIENFTGVAQVPLGLAGPLRINGEHANGEFLIPLATTEGSLVASYSRGMKVASLAGGVTTTISGGGMQRAPVFEFASAREARDFIAWVDEHLAEIRAEAEATSRVARLVRVEPYLSNKFAFLRFNFTTGDAAGQNMVGKATYAAYQWILAHQTTVRRAYLESNFATDKKASFVNVLHPRGKRVTAEATVPRELLREHLRVEPEQLAHHWAVANIGAMLSGANNNGLHSVNAITAMFIATGQDVANVAEGAAATVYTEITPDQALYFSITIPSLIVATHGGGTHLATQRECLEMLGCWGKGKVEKLAEIVAATVLAGELSLAAAISSLEWVSAHEQLGRNR
ncbi:MAG TPA: hydroxymethylglutaryl-CoA reductase [Gemmatimonadaceae bacterium]|nr:hydroxymethylglutaryl-CoA reductase [Gemmatimonadaceae bacterium]